MDKNTMTKNKHLEIYVSLDVDTQARLRIDIEERGLPTPLEGPRRREPSAREMEAICGRLSVRGYSFESLMRN